MSEETKLLLMTQIALEEKANVNSLEARLEYLQQQFDSLLKQYRELEDKVCSK